MSAEEIAETNQKSVEDVLNTLEEQVKALYKFRDEYFETHGIEEAINKQQNVKEELNKLEKNLEVQKDVITDQFRAKFYYLYGYACNVLPEFNKSAFEYLTKAIKLDPKLVEAWISLGISYWKNDDLKASMDCFINALNYGKHKEAYRCLSMLFKQIPPRNREEVTQNLEKALRLAKEAIKVDPTDGLSWEALGNAHLSCYFGIKQDEKTLKMCMSAYMQAEKDVVAKSLPNLHYNKGVVHRYEEQFLDALQSFKLASRLSPTWDGPIEKLNKLIKYINEMDELIKTKGKMKAKRLSQLQKSINEQQLGMYKGGYYLNLNGQVFNTKRVKISELSTGENKERVVLGKVVCSVYNEETVPFTFAMVDEDGTCVAVTIYNLAAGKGVIIGDSVAIPEPVMQHVNFTYEEHVYDFKLIRVKNPITLVINGKKATRDLLADVQMSIFKEFD